MEIDKRIVALRDALGLSQKAFAADLKISQKTVSYWEQGRNEPQISVVRTICNKYGVNIDWMVNGEGEMFQGKRVLATKDLENAIHVPITGIVSAGAGQQLHGIEAFEVGEMLVVDRALFRAPPSKSIHAMRVSGYSMIPMLLPDSWVIFEVTDQWSGDGLYVVNWRNELMVKILQVTPDGQYHIKSVNKDYDSWDVDPEDQSIMIIIGRVLRTVI